MRFRYVGAGDDPPKETVYMGRVPFVLNGDPVDVEDEHMIAKLKANHCFESVRGRKPKAIADVSTETNGDNGDNGEDGGDES